MLLAVSLARAPKLPWGSQIIENSHCEQVVLTWDNEEDAADFDCWQINAKELEGEYQREVEDEEVFFAWVPKDNLKFMQAMNWYPIAEPVYLTAIIIWNGDLSQSWFYSYKTNDVYYLWTELSWVNELYPEEGIVQTNHLSNFEDIHEIVTALEANEEAAWQNLNNPVQRRLSSSRFQFSPAINSVMAAPHRHA